MATTTQLSQTKVEEPKLGKVIQAVEEPELGKTGEELGLGKTVEESEIGKAIDELELGKAVESNPLVEIERKSGVSFPVELVDGKRLISLGLRKKSILAISLKIYSFGIYADVAKLREAIQEKIKENPEKLTEEMFRVVIDGDFGVMVRMVMVFGGLTMSIVRKNFDEGLGASLKKINGGKKDDQLLNMVMGNVSDGLKLPSGSEIEITRMPGYVLQTKVKGEVVSEVQSELLCRAYFNMYLGEAAFDKDAKERFGQFLLSSL